MGQLVNGSVMFRDSGDSYCIYRACNLVCFICFPNQVILGGRILSFRRLDESWLSEVELWATEGPLIDVERIA